MGRSVMFQAHSQERSSSIWPGRARKASTPATTRGSSRWTPSLSLKRTRWRITRTPTSCPGPGPAAGCRRLLGAVRYPGHEVAYGAGRVRDAFERYLDVSGRPFGVRDDHVRHEDHEDIDGYLLRIH